MFGERIIRAWRDPEYRLGLSAEERAELPEHPAGAIELTDEELELAAGGFVPSHIPAPSYTNSSMGRPSSNSSNSRSNSQSSNSQSSNSQSNSQSSNSQSSSSQSNSQSNNSSRNSNSRRPSQSASSNSSQSWRRYSYPSSRR